MKPGTPIFDRHRPHRPHNVVPPSGAPATPPVKPLPVPTKPAPPTKPVVEAVKPLPPEVDVRWLSIRNRGLPVDLHFVDGEELHSVLVTTVEKYAVIVTREDEEYVVMKPALAWVRRSRNEVA